MDQASGHRRYLLLDFDGPICDIYAGLTDISVANHLRKLITGNGVTIPDEIRQTPDPLAVFAYAATVSADLAERVESEMTEQELAAVPTARPTAYVHDVVTSCRDSGRPIAIVSNNSDRAVRAYLTRHGLDDRVDLVVARTSPDPAFLKPNPHLIEQAITNLGALPRDSALVGDSTTDVQAGQLAGISTIGYANRSGKRATLAAAGATAIINGSGTNMGGGFRDRVMACFRCDGCGALNIAVAKGWPGNKDPLKWLLTKQNLEWEPQPPEEDPDWDFPDVPARIADAAAEAYACCHLADAYRAAVIMARAVIEATAKDKGINKGLAARQDRRHEWHHQAARPRWRARNSPAG